MRYRAAADAVYDETVDATEGAVLRRANMVKSDAPALAWERYPGSPVGGSAQTVDLEGSGWLGAGATTLDGTNAHAFSDFNDDDVAQASEEVTRTGGAFSFPLTPATGSTCDAAHLCSWTGAARRGRPTARRRRSSPFYFANRFHDHLASAPIGFGTAVGSFEGADRLQLNTDDPVAIAFCQPIAATDALRTGLYAKMLTFTLSINQP